MPSEMRGGLCNDMGINDCRSDGNDLKQNTNHPNQQCDVFNSINIQARNTNTVVRDPRGSSITTSVSSNEHQSPDWLKDFLSQDLVAELLSSQPFESGGAAGSSAAPPSPKSLPSSPLSSLLSSSSSETTASVSDPSPKLQKQQQPDQNHQPQCASGCGLLQVLRVWLSFSLQSSSSSYSSNSISSFASFPKYSRDANGSAARWCIRVGRSHKSNGVHYLARLVGQPLRCHWQLRTTDYSAGDDGEKMFQT